MAHAADAALGLDRLAEELQTPAEVVVDSAHEGTEAWENSYLEILPSTVWVLAVKQAEGPRRRDDFTDPGRERRPRLP